MTTLRYAIRQLLKTPGFTIIAVLIAAVGIGAATGMFSIVNALVLRPVALPHPDRLVAVYETNLSRNLPFFSVSLPNYWDWKTRAQSWESLAALDWRSMNLTGSIEAELVPVKAVTANFLPTLGISLASGRNFLEAEDRPGAGHVAIVTEGFRRRHFDSTVAVLGRTLLFDGTPYTIVGVISSSGPWNDDMEVLVPMAADPAQEGRLNHELMVYGRLKPGVSLEQADTELKAIATGIWAEQSALDRGWSIRLVPFAHDLVDASVRRTLYVLLGAVGLLLLIACANLSNLLLIRASSRAYELAVRTALGASRLQVIRQIVVESLLVTAAGGVAGVLAALWMVDLAHSAPLPRAHEISVDVSVLVVACVTTLLVGLISSLGPALKASHADPQDALKDRAPQVRHRSRIRDGMVVAQLAISLTLLVGIALLSRSFSQLLRVDPGFQTENMLTVSLRPAANPVQFYERLVERVSALPNVVGAGLINGLPLTEGNTSLNVFPHDRSILPAGQSVQANWRLVDGGYFAAMEIPVLRGHTFAGLTPDEARRSVVVSTALAHALWGDADPVGRQLNPGGGNHLLTVIGVVGDVRSQALGVPPAPTFYWSMHQFIYGPMHLVVRTSSGMAPLVAAVRSAVKATDPAVPIFRLRTFAQLRETSLEQERLVLLLLGGFAAVALFLAMLGTYGVVAFGVQQRTREIGIRLAVGAQASDILLLFAGHGARLAALGIGLGTIGSLLGTKVLAAMLYHIRPTDLLSYAGAIVVLFGVGVMASLLPARRASRTSPIVALRAE